MPAGPEPSAPKVSCLTVTLPTPRRLPLLKRSLAAYCRQTWPEREMVIVMDQGAAEDRAAIVRTVEALGRSDIRIVAPTGAHTLGALRNISWREADGDFVCVWDDDDLYHPERVERQLAAVRRTGALASCLGEVMHLFPEARRLYLTNWRATPPMAKPATLLSRRAVAAAYPEEGPEASLGEDLALLAGLRRIGEVDVLNGFPHLYVYVSHGHNITGEAHHRMLREELAVSRGLTRRREAALREGLAGVDLGPEDIEVFGHNGHAFTLAADPSRAAGALPI